MADEEIKIVLGAEDQTAAAVASAKRNVGDLASSTGKASETARLGFWGMGEAAENAAQSMGVPNQMSRQLGNSVEGLAVKMGKGALAFGLVGFAAMGLYGIYSELADRKKRVTDETIKGGIAAGNWIEGALKEQGTTIELANAKRQLAQAEFDLNKARAAAAIPALIQQLADLTAKYNDLRAVAGGDKTPLFMITESGENVFEAAERQAGKLKLEIGQVAGQLSVARAQMIMFGDANRDVVGIPPITPMSSLDDQVAEFKRTEEIRRAHAEVIMQIERDKYNAIQGLRQWDLDQEYEAELKRQAIEQHKITMLQGTQQAMGLLYEIGGKKMKAFFYLQQFAAASEAFIHYQLAAAKAVGQTGLFGIPMAKYFTAMSYIVPSLIMAKSFMGGSGGAGGSTPPSSGGYTPGSSSSGSSNTSGPSSIVININGQKAGEYELVGNILRQIYNNNGSVDGFSIDIGRSA